jgi:hypothetical protein
VNGDIRKKHVFILHNRLNPFFQRFKLEKALSKMGKKDQEFGSQVNLIQNDNFEKNHSRKNFHQGAVYHFIFSRLNTHASKSFQFTYLKHFFIFLYGPPTPAPNFVGDGKVRPLKDGPLTIGPLELRSLGHP